MKYIVNTSTDIYFNLALEEYVFKNFKDDSYILLWKNDNCIVLGKHQNAFEEINIKAVEEINVKVARRITGGGTVFHDKGNLNFSLIRPYDAKTFEGYDVFLIPVIEALNAMGIPAVKKRNSDIAIGEKKISGNAQTVKNGRVLHHGTLLFDSDLSLLSKLLKTTKASITSRAIQSFRSEVTNIKGHINNKEMTIDEFKTLLLKKMFPEGLEPVTLSNGQITEIWDIVKERYSNWEWNYGNSPKFIFEKESHLPCGVVRITLSIEKGYIKSCHVVSDDLPWRQIEMLAPGLKYSYSKIANMLEGLNDKKQSMDVDIDQLTKCFF